LVISTLRQRVCRGKFITVLVLDLLGTEEKWNDAAAAG
jgi:hypothetical protein